MRVSKRLSPFTELALYIGIKALRSRRNDSRDDVSDRTRHRYGCVVLQSHIWFHNTSEPYKDNFRKRQLMLRAIQLYKHHLKFQITNKLMRFLSSIYESYLPTLAIGSIVAWAIF